MNFLPLLFITYIYVWESQIVHNLIYPRLYVYNNANDKRIELKSIKRYQNTKCKEKIGDYAGPQNLDIKQQF